MVMPWPRTLHSRFPVAFALASTGGAIGGLLHDGGSVLGSADLKAILSIVFAGGVAGGLCSGRTFHERRWLVLAFLTLTSVTVLFTWAYVGLRDSVIIIELAIPMALAFVPFAFVYAYIVVLLTHPPTARRSTR